MNIEIIAQVDRVHDKVHRALASAGNQEQRFQEIEEAREEVEDLQEMLRQELVRLK